MLKSSIAWFTGTEPKAHVWLRCPDTKETLATDHTEPAHFDEHTGLADYDCACGARHRFEWGHPVPIYRGDVVRPGSGEEQKQKRQDADQAIRERNRAFHEIMSGPNPLTPEEIDTLRKHHPERWGAFSKWGKG